MEHPMKTTGDVVVFLQEQHREVKLLLEQVSETKGKAREKAFGQLRRAMAVHETAEEEIVHPAARRHLPNGAAIVAARLREEHAAKRALSELEDLDVDSREFETTFQKLRAAVIAHAESEEREEFYQLPDEFTEEQLLHLRKAAELAESIAPTHAHSGLESPAENLLVGPFATMVDRLRDALSGEGPRDRI